MEKPLTIQEVAKQIKGDRTLSARKVQVRRALLGRAMCPECGWSIRESDGVDTCKYCGAEMERGVGSVFPNAWKSYGTNPWNIPADEAEAWLNANSNS